MSSVFPISLSAIATLLFPAFVADHSILFSYSPLAVAFLAGIYKLAADTQKLETDRKMPVYTRILGLLFSAMTSCGYYLETIGSVPYFSLKWLCSVAVYGEIFSCLLQMLWKWLMQLERRLSAGEKTGTVYRILDRPAVLAVIFLICWTPCYLSTFPGAFFADATSEYLQLVKGYSAEFPMLHSVLIIGLLELGNLLTGSYNTGIAVYVIAQMILLATLFAHILWKLGKMGKNKVLLLCMAVYFALFPVIHVLVTTTVRDILFSGMITWLVFQVYELKEDPAGFLGNRKKTVVFGLTITWTIFARSNFVGLMSFVCIAAVALLAFLLCRKKTAKGAGQICISFAGSYILLGSVLLAICSPLAESAFNNYMSLFSQSIARAYYYEEENWTEDQKQKFAEYFNMEKLSYVAENADYTKSCLQVDENTMLPFLRFWCSMGRRYPAHYLDGMLANTLQVWFPGSPVDAYVESGQWDYEKSFFLVLDFVESPGEHRLWLPGVRSFYYDLGMCISFEKLPVVSMLFSIGFQVWMLLNGVFYLSYRKMRSAGLPLKLLLVYVLVTAFSPLVYIRYYAALFLAFPITLVLTLQPEKKVRSQFFE